MSTQSTPYLEDQGVCSPPPIVLTCNGPELTPPFCKNEQYITQYNPAETPAFTVVAPLKDASCEDILDESDRQILTVIS